MGLEDVQAAPADGPVDHLTMGAGIELETRLDVIRAVFTTSDKTTVHMKDTASGKAGMFPFAEAVLRGLVD